MSKYKLRAVLGVGLAALFIAACGSSSKSSSTASSASASASSSASSSSGGGKADVAVLLPDTQSSVRWEQFDRPYLNSALTAAGISHTIVNAQGDPATQKTQAEALMTQGATVLLVDPIDSGVGAAIESEAHSRGVKVIDYDRISLGGSRDYYVSFNNVRVGQVIGKGMVSCITDWKVNKPNILVMDGAATDNNATLFAQGYNGILKPYFESEQYIKVGEPAGTWDPPTALDTFQQQYTAHPNINAVVTPNDANANAVISALKTLNIKPRTFPTTGQDAEVTGLQNILTGYQCMTVYKPIYLEAQASVALALYLRAGQQPPAGLVNGTTADSQTHAKVKSVLLTPVSVNASNMAKTVVKDGFVKTSDLCQGAAADACQAAGIKP